MDWISVRDKLPELGDLGISEDVLIYDNNMRAYEICCLVEDYEGGEPYFAASTIDATHWMPLPERPE